MAWRGLPTILAVDTFHDHIGPGVLVGAPLDRAPLQDCPKHYCRPNGCVEGGDGNGHIIDIAAIGVGATESPRRVRSYAQTQVNNDHGWSAVNYLGDSTLVI